MKEYKKTINTYSIKKNKTNIPSAKIKNSKDVYNYIKKYLYNDSIDVYETFWLLLLNRANNIIGFVKISQGGLSGTIVDVKLIGKYILNELAQGSILIHNHPTGNVNPSKEDKKITKKIKEICELLDTNLLDHLIVASDNAYFSFADKHIL